MLLGRSLLKFVRLQASRLYRDVFTIRSKLTKYVVPPSLDTCFQSACAGEVRAKIQRPKMKIDFNMIY